MKLLRYFLLLVLFGIFSNAHPLLAQTWVQQAKVSDSSIVSIYFLDKQGHPEMGFAGAQNGQVFYTVNYGQNWYEASTLLQIHGPVTSFAFQDASHGWLTCRQGNHPGCYQTLDGGKTWTQMGTNTWWNRFSIFYNNIDGRLFMSSPDDQFRYSVDNGVTWNVAGPSYLNGIAFSTPRIGIVTCFSGANYTTVDGGLSWRPGGLSLECWSPLAADTLVFFAVSEATWTVFCSKNAGGKWQARGTIPRHPTGDIHGLCEQLYVQTDSGFFYSVDEGYTWHSIGGPSNQADSRFYTVGTTLYAGDRKGAIYKLVDYDRPPEGKLVLDGPVPQILTPSCDGIDTTILIFGSTTCQSTTFLGFDFDSLHSSPGISIFQPAGPFKYNNLYLQHVSFPYTFNLDDTSFIPLHVRYRPSGGPDSAYLTLHYRIGAYYFDTTILFKASRDRRLSVQLHGTPLELTSKTACQTVTGIFTITNGKCDSVTVVNVRPVDSLHFHVLTKFPSLLGPFGTVGITLAGSGQSKDTFTTVVDITTEVAGVQSDLQVQATLVVQHEGPVKPGISPNSFVAPTNICAKRRYVFPIRNLGCSKMICDTPLWVISVPELSIVQQPNFPDTIAPGDQDSLVLEFAPSVVKSNTAILRLRMTSGPTSVDTTVQIHTNAYDLSKATLSDNAMEFDSLLICNENERSVFIRNESCKATQLIQVLPPGDASFVSVSPPLNSWIGPGDSVEVRVHLKPNAPGDKQDSISFLYQDTSGTQQYLTVALHTYIIADVPRYTMSAGGVVWDTVAPCSVHTASITISNVSLCDTIWVNAGSLAGSPWFTFDTSQLPIAIPPSQNHSITVGLQTTSDSAGHATLHLRGTGIDTVILLDASTAPIVGDKVYSTYSDTTFHAKLCGSDTKHFWLHNRTCEPLSVDHIYVTDSTQFGMIAPPSLPYSLNAGDSIELTVLYNADNVVTQNALLHYETADGSLARNISLAGITTTRPQIARLALATWSGTNSISRLPGDTLSLAVLSMDDVADSLGLTAITGTLAYDHDLLSLQSAVAVDGWTNANPTSDDIHLTSTSYHSLKQSGPIAILNFTTTFAEPRTSTVQFTTPALNDGDSTFAHCVLTAAASGTAAVTITPFCNDSLLGDALLGLPFALEGIKASSASDGVRLDVTLRASTPAMCHLTLTDMRGVVIDDFGTASLHTGEQTVTLLSHAPSGMYILSLGFEGRTMGRKISIIR